VSSKKTGQLITQGPHSLPDRSGESNTHLSEVPRFGTRDNDMTENISSESLSVHHTSPNVGGYLSLITMGNHTNTLQLVATWA